MERLGEESGPGRAATRCRSASRSASSSPARTATSTCPNGRPTCSSAANAAATWSASTKVGKSGFMVMMMQYLPKSGGISCCKRLQKCARAARSDDGAADAATAASSLFRRQLDARRTVVGAIAAVFRGTESRSGPRRTDATDRGVGDRQARACPTRIQRSRGQVVTMRIPRSRCASRLTENDHSLSSVSIQRTRSRMFRSSRYSRPRFGSSTNTAE